MLKKGKSTNFTAVEKKYFLQILKNYAQVIENKKSDAATLSEKKEAWDFIATDFNSSSIITEKVKLTF